MNDDCKCNEDGYCVEHAEMLRIGRGEPALCADEKIAQDAYGEYMRYDSDDARGGFVRIVSQAIATARADGYRAGIEAAAKTLDADVEGGINRREWAERAQRRIRALAPAATTEKP